MIWLIVFMAGASWLIVFPTTILSGFPRLFYHSRGFGTGSAVIDITNIEVNQLARADHPVGGGMAVGVTPHTGNTVDKFYRFRSPLKELPLDKGFHLIFQGAGT
jgi:hypothetical protein